MSQLTHVEPHVAPQHPRPTATAQAVRRALASWSRRVGLAWLALSLAHPGAMAQNVSAAAVAPKSKLALPGKDIAAIAAAAMAQRQGAQDELARVGDAEIIDMTMAVGESRVLPAPGVARIAVGSGKVMTASALDGKEVLVFGNAAGNSSLLVWDHAGQLRRYAMHVTATDSQRMSRDIAGYLSTLPNVKTSTIGETVIVEGDQLSDADLSKIDELSKRYPQVLNFTNRQGWEKMVLIDVKVVEFPTNELREMGLKWNAAGGVAVGAIGSLGRAGNTAGLGLPVPAGGTGQLPITNADGSVNGIPIPSSPAVLSAMNLGLNATLKLMAQQGRASVLAEPQLSARNGSKATFLAGGEFPFTVSTLAGQTVVFKPYGIKLEIVPRVDRNGTVRAVIESEVSAIDGATITAAGPALTTRKTNTEFNVRNGETLVLSGLLSRKTSTTIDKVPMLGDLPVLGALFRSKRFQNDETELVVFVTPTVVDASTPELVERVRNATQRLQEDTPKAPYLPKLTPLVEPSSPLRPASDKVAARSPAPEQAPLPAMARSFPAPASVEPAPQQSMASAYAPTTPAARAEAPAVAKPAAQASYALVPSPRANAAATPAAELPLVYGQSPQAAPSASWLDVLAPEPPTQASAPPKEAAQWGSPLEDKASKKGAAQRPTQAAPAKVSQAAQARNAPVAAEPDDDLSMASIFDAGRAQVAGIRALPAAGTQATAASPGTVRRTNRADVPMRTGPDAKAPSLRTLNKDTEVQVLQTAANKDYVEVAADNRTGWVMAKWLDSAEGERGARP